MKDHNSFFTATGIPSLFLIFSVLCLAVLSLLTLGNSRSELSTARNSMQQTEDYYNACSQASTVSMRFRQNSQMPTGRPPIRRIILPLSDNSARIILSLLLTRKSRHCFSPNHSLTLSSSLSA